MRNDACDDAPGGCFVGCASRNAAAPAPVTIQSDADYDRLWDGAVAVVGARFPIAAPRKAKATIETDCAHRRRVDDRAQVTTPDADADSPEENLRTRPPQSDRHRRSLRREPLVVRIGKQRLLREHPNVLPAGTYALSIRRPYEDATSKATAGWHAGPRRRASKPSSPAR